MADHKRIPGPGGAPSGSPQPPAGGPAVSFKGVPTAAAIGAVVVAAMSIGYWLSGRGGAGHAPVESAQTSNLRDAERQRSAQIVVARTKQQAAVDLGTRGIELVDAGLGEEERWRTEVEPLLTNQEGRALASDDPFVASFTPIYEAERPSREQIASVRPRLEQLMRLPQEALNDPAGSAFVPDEALTKELERARAEAEKNRNAYKSAREQVASLVAVTRAKGVKPAGIPLQQAILERRNGAVAADVARKQAADELAAAERKKVEDAIAAKRRDAELARLRADEEARLEAARKQAELEAKLAAERARRERLLAMANDPAIQARFELFFKKSIFFVGCGRNFLPCRYDYPQPASFKALQKVGALNDIGKLILVTTSRHPDNDRGVWKKPSSAEEMEYLRENQQLLAELGPIWVEQGKLAP